MALSHEYNIRHFTLQLAVVAFVFKVNVSTRLVPFTVLLRSSEITRNCPGSISIVYGEASELSPKGSGAFTHPGPHLSRFFVLELVHALEESITQIIDLRRRDDDTNPHFGTFDGKGRVRLEHLDTLGHLNANLKKGRLSTHTHAL